MAETLANGVVVPQGTDVIDASGVAAMRALGTSVDTKLGAKADSTYVDTKITEVTPKLYYRGTPPAGTNFDTWLTAENNGYWTFSALAAQGYTGLPTEFADKPGGLLHNGTASRVTNQIYYPYGFYSTQPLIRYVETIATNTWTPWRPMTGGDLSPATRHAILQAMMVQAIGPVDTKGLGAVAIRVDHGFTNLRDKVLPLTRARGIKLAVAYNPRNWHYAENTGVTATDLNGWVSAGDVEIMNHSADHLPADTEEALYDEIVNGLAEIEAELPAAAGKVWGFAPPGVSSGNWMGFDDGRTPDGWNTYAGRLIQQHHAVGTGYLAGTSRRVLDGQLRDGLGHITIDGQPLADLKAAVDEVIASRKGLQLMLHPSQLDTTGKLTTAQFTELLDYIVAKRTAGQLAVLSPYQLLLADATRPTPTVAEVPGLAGRLTALEYTSGVRDVTSLLPVAPTSGRVLLHRIGRTVWFSLDELILPSVGASFTSLGTLPVGFRPAMSSVDFPTSPRLAADNDTDGIAGVRVSSNGNSFLYQGIAGRAYRGIGSFSTNDAAPATLPGSPA